MINHPRASCHRRSENCARLNVIVQVDLPGSRQNPATRPGYVYKTEGPAAGSVAALADIHKSPEAPF